MAASDPALAAPAGTTFQPSSEECSRIGVVRDRLKAAGAGVHAAVVGGGKSGLAAANLLRRIGCDPVLFDDKPSDNLMRAGFEVRPLSGSEVQADVVVLSPGISRFHPSLRSSREGGVLVGEIELASWFLDLPIVAITGTNGKSTTTALTAHLLNAAGVRTFAGGNLGRPYAEIACTDEAYDVAVLELSSYQLESLVFIRFKAGCWLNLTPDHGERYADVATYALAKRRVFELSEVSVANAEDAEVVRAARSFSNGVRWFQGSVGPRLSNGTRVVRDRVAERDGHAVEQYDLVNDAMPGSHNLSNMCAAIECARSVAHSPVGLQLGLSSLGGLPHRIELVGTIGGVRYLNDSKATNVDSVVTAVRAVPGPKVLIAGGRDKGAPWQPLVDAARQSNVVCVLAIGEATPIVEQSFAGVIPIERAETLEKALLRAQTISREGWSVLLSPACSSFDQFKNYEDRGDTMRRLVAGMMEASNGSGR